MANSSSIASRNLAFTLLGSAVLAASEVLNSLKRLLAVSALWSLGGLVDSLGLQCATRCSHSSDLVLSGVVGVASVSCPTTVRHGC